MPITPFQAGFSHLCRSDDEFLSAVLGRDLRGFRRHRHRFADGTDFMRMSPRFKTGLTSRSTLVLRLPHAGGFHSAHGPPDGNGLGVVDSLDRQLAMTAPEWRRSGANRGGWMPVMKPGCRFEN